MKTSTFNQGILTLIVLVLVLSSAPAVQYTSQELGRETGKNIVGDDSGGILNITPESKVFYGEFGQSLVTISNPTTHTQTVTIQLDASVDGTLSDGTKQKSVTLAPNESTEFSIDVPESDNGPTNEQYTLQSDFEGGTTKFSKTLPVRITRDWDYRVASDGSEDFTTIQAAVDAANAGDEIRVESGLYSESVDINKPIWLSGETSSTPTLIATTSYGFSLTANDITIRSFEIDASTVQDGITNTGTGTSGTNIFDTEISGASRACFYTEDNTVRKVAYNTFENCGNFGVYGFDAILQNISHNTVRQSNTGLRWESKQGGKPECTGPPPQRPDGCNNGSGGSIPSLRIIQSARDNQIVSNSQNIYLETWSGTILSYNQLGGATSGDALVMDGKNREDGELTATNNYWGASNGPSGGISDSQTGATATGDGGSIIITTNGAVRFDPWLSIAPSDVGDTN